jgi:para-nitrobenzyl esterase
VNRAAAAIIGAALAVAAQCAAAAVVVAGQVRYEGATVTARDGTPVRRFSAIRFAEAPTGTRRWRPPVPTPAQGTVDATDWPPACMQDAGNVAWYGGVAAAFGQSPSVAPSLPPVSEDCLFLNVWSRSAAAAERLPVMVWIHGGGNRGGWSFEPNYRGLELAARAAVVVSIQYRLGVFGFLAHADLSAEHRRAASGNYGILDQIAALRWVRRHVAAFGGDPNNVTVFGESASGESSR